MYIEYVLIDNFIIDYILLSTAVYAVKVKKCRWRIALSAVLGAIYASILPLFKMPAAISLVTKTAMGIIMTAIAAKYPSAKKAIFCTALFFLITFCCGGALIAIGFLADGEVSADGIYRYTSSYPIIGIIGGALLFALAVKRALYKLYRKKNLYPFLRHVELVKGDKKIEAEAFIDSGNNLSDSLTGFPVIVISKKLAGNLLGLNGNTPLRYIKVGTVSGTDKMIIFPIDYLKIYNGGEEHIIESVMVGISKQPLNENYDVLLGPCII